jgi:hypothetical protein
MAGCRHPLAGNSSPPHDREPSRPLEHTMCSARLSIRKPGNPGEPLCGVVSLSLASFAYREVAHPRRSGIYPKDKMPLFVLRRGRIMKG